MRARSKYFALDFFSLKNRAALRNHTDLALSPTRSVRRFHVPRIWKCSINGRGIPVKRKTQNVVDIFVPHQSVVVRFRVTRCA